MVLYLTKKLGMTWDGEQARVKDVPKSLAIVFSRMTMFKMAAWSLNFYENRRGVTGMSYVTLPETIETAQKIEQLVKQIHADDDVEKVKNIVKSWSSKMKQEDINLQLFDLDFFPQYEVKEMYEVPDRISFGDPGRLFDDV